MGVHPSGLEQAQPGCSASPGQGLQPLSASPTALGWAVPGAAALSTAWPFLTSLLEHRLRVPPSRSLGGLQETCSSFSVQSRLLFKLLPPGSGVRGKPSLGAVGSRGRDRFAARVPVRSLLIPGCSRLSRSGAGTRWRTWTGLAQPCLSPALPLALRAAFPCWDKVAAAGSWTRLGQRSEGSPGRSSSSAQCPHPAWVISALAPRAGTELL